MRHLDDRLSAYLDGELEHHEMNSLLSHLQGCEDCRQELEDVSAARAAVRALPTIEVTPQILGVGARNVIPMRRHRMAWTAAAAAVALVAAVTAASLTTKPPQAVSPSQLGRALVGVSSNESNFTPSKALVLSEEGSG